MTLKIFIQIFITDCITSSSNRPYYKYCWFWWNEWYETRWLYKIVKIIINFKHNFTSSRNFEQGCGGGIYITLDREIPDEVFLQNITFKGCKAVFGGALYIYSQSYHVISLKMKRIRNRLQQMTFSTVLVRFSGQYQMEMLVIVNFQKILELS